MSLYFPDVRFPKTIVRRANGFYYDAEYNPIPESKAIELMSQYEKSIIKATRDSSSGAGVSLMHKSEINEKINTYQKDFICQELLAQNSETAKFNASSVNIVRIITFAFEGEIHHLSSTLRIGAAGAINDNSITNEGKGMIVVNVKNDGSLDETGYYSNGTKVYESHNGTPFKGTVIPNFSKAIELAINMHKRLPYFGFVGYDIAFDSDGDPVVIEYNINSPGILYYQYTGGPLFGDLTESVARKFKRN